MSFIETTRGDHIPLSEIVRISAPERDVKTRTIFLRNGEHDSVYAHAADRAMTAGGQLLSAPLGHQFIEVVSGGDDDTDDLYFTPIIAFFVTPELDVVPVLPEGVQWDRDDYLILQTDGRVCAPGGSTLYDNLDSYRASLRAEKTSGRTAAG